MDIIHHTIQYRGEGYTHHNYHIIWREDIHTTIKYHTILREDTCNIVTYHAILREDTHSTIKYNTDTILGGRIYTMHNKPPYNIGDLLGGKPQRGSLRHSNHQHPEMLP